MKEIICQTPLSQLEKSTRSALQGVRKWHKQGAQRTLRKVLARTPNSHERWGVAKSKLQKYKKYYEDTPTPQKKAK